MNRSSLARVKRTTAVEEVALSKSIRRGDVAALHELIERNLPFATSEAAKFRRFHRSMDDLISAARVGMCIAARKFDATKARFGTYAVHYIRREITTFLRDRRLVRVPAKKAWDAPPEYCVPFSRRRGDPETVLPPEKILAAPGEQERVAMARDVETALSTVLTEKEQRVMRLRHGLDGNCPRTLREVGLALGGLSRERVRQIELHAADALRRFFARDGVTHNWSAA